MILFNTVELYQNIVLAEALDIEMTTWAIESVTIIQQEFPHNCPSVIPPVVAGDFAFLRITCESRDQKLRQIEAFAVKNHAAAIWQMRLIAQP